MYATDSLPSFSSAVLQPLCQAWLPGSWRFLAAAAATGWVIVCSWGTARITMFFMAAVDTAEVGIVEDAGGDEVGAVVSKMFECNGGAGSGQRARGRELWGMVWCRGRMRGRNWMTV